MGVPKFYRWMSERYPCLSETVKEFQIPEFDNLYLDMNGIIHICSHPEDDNPHFRITEEKIFSDIFHYIEFLFRIIRPRKVFYMAVDGVAPRAKMNQQRGRRFRSAREAEDLIKKAQEKGEVLPTEKRFDSNCITPGTEFMVKLQEQLKYFVVQKVTTDPLWQGPEIYLSGHETPGEGEHKVMDFIRYEKSQPGYDPNTRHCLYGLDADLIVLGLATHEPHFSLLREEVRFGGRKERNKRPSTPEETTFHLLHLSLLREYLDYEFSAVKKKNLPFPYDIECIIDDWILMGFLVGNDFIPHLPNLHINHDALPYLWRTYEEVLPSLDGYLNEGGHLNLRRFEKYLEALAKFDIEKFSDQFTDMKWMESRLGKKHVNEAAARAAQEEERKKERKKSFNDTNPFAALEGVLDEFDPSLSDSGADTFTEPTEETTLSDLSDDDVDTFDAEFRQHKRNYYMDKLDYQTVTPQVLQDQARGYVTAIQWILLYYFEGVPSWSWFYPHHYAPYISDVKGFSNMRIEFQLGKAFLPFQQLMAVLPAASKDLLPEAFRGLMTMDTSPIIDFYPVNFKTDLNGKQQDWEAVVLIPFIEEERLLEAMQPKYDTMTKAETARNKHGPSTVFVYDEERQEPYLSRLPGIFPDITVNQARQEEIPLELYRVDGNKLKKGLLPEVRLDVYFPGFPTLFHIKHSAELKKEGVKVFQMNSRGENMILSITHREADLNLPIEEAAHIYLGNSVYVGWPHLHEAKVVEVSDGETSYKLLERKGEKGKKSTYEKICRELQKDESAVWRSESSSIKERYHDRLGVNIGRTNILLHALPMTGRRYVCGSHGKITLEKQFCVRAVPYALQATVKDIAIHDPDFQQFRSLEELFSTETSVFMIGQPHYGCQGEVVDVEDGRVRVNFTVPAEPDMTNVMRRQESLETNYMPGYMIAQRLGISGLFLSRLTGSILVIQGSRDNPKANRINVGLNLKHTKRNQELPGYTRKVDDRWTYSQATLELVRAYIDKFHDVMQVLSAGGGGGDLMSEEEIFPPDSHQYHQKKENQCTGFVRSRWLGLKDVPAHVNIRNKRSCLLLSVSCLATAALHYRNSEYKLKHMVDFVRNLPCNNVKPLSTGADILEEGVVKAIEEEVDTVNAENRRKQKKVKMQVKPHLLFRPLINQGPLVPDQTATYWLYDRVVAVKLGYPVPLGLRGVVVGIHPDEKESDTLYDVVFDAEFVGGISVRCSSNRGYRVPAAAMINLSHGERKEKRSHDGAQGLCPAIGTWGLGSGANLNTNHSYSDLMSKSGGHRGRGKEPHMQWGSGDRRPNHRHNDQFDSSQKQDKYNYYNGSDSFNKGFGQKNGGFTNSNPQFVTPKVTQTQFSKRTPNRTQQTGGKSQPSQDAASTNSEFANMWKELQAGTGQTTPSGGNLIQEPSLQQAALALGQITPPTTRHQKKPELSGGSDSATVQDSESENRFGASSSKKIDLQTLFDRASLQKDATEKDEFIAMMDSLELSGKTQKEEEVVGGINSSNNNATEQDGSSALKHMLKIGSDTGSTPDGGSVPNTSSPTKAYGKQLSVQELFDGAKQQETSPPQPKQQQQQQQQKEQERKQQQGQGHRQQQRQGQRQQHQGQGHVNHRPHESGPRNPVLDLEARCKNLGLAAPGYDFKRVQGHFTSMVMLTNGARFEGSECGSREEAAESAASIALLHLQALDRTQHPPFMNIPPPGMMMPPPPHLCSPNSAFSPVRPGTAQMFVPRGGYSQLRHPRHQFPGPPQSQRYQGHGHHQHGGPRHQHPANQNAGSGSWNHHQGNQSDMGLGGSYQSTEASRKPGLVTDPAFIPLQVARNQKTPQKRRDAQPQDHVDNSAAPIRDSDSYARSENKQTDSSQSQSGSSSALRTEHCKSHKPEPKSAGGGAQAQAHGKKRRPRIAANLNFS